LSGGPLPALSGTVQRDEGGVIPDKVNPSLEKVARFLNLLGADNVRPAQGDVVVIVHGPATPIIAENGAYATKTGAATNPNLALIAALKRAGVSVRVCSQALVGNGIAPAEVDKVVEVDVGAYDDGDVADTRLGIDPGLIAFTLSRSAIDSENVPSSRWPFLGGTSDKTSDTDRMSTACLMIAAAAALMGLLGSFQLYDGLTARHDVALMM
jgi:intracellular sulfur oxidation DsrE/DsrF family protein